MSPNIAPLGVLFKGRDFDLFLCGEGVSAHNLIKVQLENGSMPLKYARLDSLEGY